MAGKTKRFTREDEAIGLVKTMESLRARTLCPTIYRMAHEAAEFAANAAWQLNNAGSLDRDSGGGSSTAWQERSRARANMKKARDAMRAMLALEGMKNDAEYGSASLENLFFLRRVETASKDGGRFSARVVDQPFAQECRFSGWVETVSPDIMPYLVLTGKGAEALDRGRHLLEGVRMLGQYE